MQFILEKGIPKARKKDVTYGSFVCTVQPEKADPNRTRFTVGGDKINYPGEVDTPTAKMLIAKILFNSVISTPGKIHDNGHIKFLLHDSPQAARIHQGMIVRHARRNHQRIQTRGECKWQKFHLPLHPQKNAWPSSSRIVSKQIAWKTTQQTWLLQK